MDGRNKSYFNSALKCQIHGEMAVKMKREFVSKSNLKRQISFVFSPDDLESSINLLLRFGILIGLIPSSQKSFR